MTQICQKICEKSHYANLDLNQNMLTLDSQVQFRCLSVLQVILFTELHKSLINKLIMFFLSVLVNLVEVPLSVCVDPRKMTNESISRKG